MKSKVRNQRRHGCFFPLFFGIFALLGTIFFVFVTAIPVYSLIRAQSWIGTPCRINSSEVEEHRGDDGYTYSIAITYSYEFGGQTYQGDRYNFSMGSSSGYDGKARVVEAYPPDLATLCYVDPANPQSSVINRSPGWYLLLGLIPLPFMAIGYGGLCWFLFWGRKQQGDSAAAAAGGGQHRARSFSSSRVASGGVASSGASATAGGSQTLNPHHAPWLRPVVVGLIALVWNGFVAILIFTAVLPSLRAGNPEWGLLLFVVPFVLVGLAVIGATFYFLLAAFNPRVRVDLDDTYLTVGETSSVRWSFDGRADRIRKLTFTFEGKESATYRRGTSTQTAHHTFYSEELLSTDHPASLARGRFELRVPERTMPSFESSNNKIEWSVTVHGDIPRWPDVSEVLPVTLHPASRKES